MRESAVILWNLNYSAIKRLLLVFWLMAMTHSGPLSAADNSPAGQAYNNGLMAFEDGSYEWAEKHFGNFLQTFPQSQYYADVLLKQAQCRFHLKNHAGAIELLKAGLPRAGKLADQYHYWIGESLFQQGDFPGAADAYATIPANYPTSLRVLEAAYQEALCRFKQGIYARTIELLRKPDGAFQKALQTRANDPAAHKGRLLLGEALLASERYKEAEDSLIALGETGLTPDQAWQRQLLLVRVQTGAQKLSDALQSAVRLQVLAKATTQPALIAESIALQGSLHERLNNPDAAAQAYEQNLTPETPANRRREALLKVIELTIGRDKTAEAAQRLEQFLKANPSDTSLDVVLVTLGELRLKEYYRATDAAAKTNLLVQAQGFLEQSITNYPNSALQGKARFNRGWCWWENGKTAESLADFKMAAETLPASEDKAIAIFKWADTQFQLQDFAGATTNYDRVLVEFAQFPRVKDGLFSQTLYQLARSAIRAGNLAIAENAVKRILEWYPDNYFSESSLLLVGQALNRANRATDARDLFQEFQKKFAQSSLGPEIELALARTYVTDRQWTNAIRVFENWTARHTNHVARPRAEFDLGWLHYKAGNETNALMVYTNFVVRFPTNALAARAQYWIGDFYFRATTNFSEAEKNFQRVFQNTNWPQSDLKYQARLSAARAAFGRQSYSNAREYLTNLLNDAQCPPEIQAQAFLEYGDILVEQAVAADALSKLNNFALAINAFEEVQKRFTNRIVVAAWGRLAECHFQLGAQDHLRYEESIKFYSNVITSDLAEPEMKNIALVGMGTVREKQARLRTGPEQEALFKQALDLYTGVFYEAGDSFMRQKAGLAAGRLYEELQQWSDALRIYVRLQDLLPPMRTTLENRINQLRELPGVKRN